MPGDSYYILEEHYDLRDYDLYHIRSTIIPVPEFLVRNWIGVWLG